MHLSRSCKLTFCCAYASLLISCLLHYSSSRCNSIPRLGWIAFHWDIKKKTYATDMQHINETTIIGDDCHHVSSNIYVNLNYFCFYFVTIFSALSRNWCFFMDCCFYLYQVSWYKWFSSFKVRQECTYQLSTENTQHLSADPITKIFMSTNVMKFTVWLNMVRVTARFFRPKPKFWKSVSD